MQNFLIDPYQLEKLNLHVRQSGTRGGGTLLACAMARPAVEVVQVRRTADWYGIALLW